MNAEANEVQASVPLTRDQLRAALVGKKHAPKSVLATLFGVEIELRQPTLESIVDAKDDADAKTRTTDVFIKYAYVPGTDERIFEDTDRVMILRWPFSEELLKVQEKIAGLTGIDLSAAEVELTTDPLED